MQVMTSKESLYINQVVGEKTITEIVEEDFVVPDIKPDILNTINTSGTVCIYKKEVMDSKIRIDGCINTYIMYLADDDNLRVRGLNTNLEFSKIIDFDSVKEGMMLESVIDLKSIECRVLNGRKVNIKAIMDINSKILSNEETEFVNGVEEIKDIQILNENMNLNSLLGRGNTKAYAKDTIVLDSIDNLIEVLKADIKIMNKELKISYNKVLVKADAGVKILYLTEDGRICTKSQIIPVMGFIDMQDISDEDICDIDFEIKNMIVKPNNMEEHSIYIEVEFEVSCNAYNKKQVNLIQDLYSPSIDLEYNQKQINAISEKKIIKDVFSIRETNAMHEIGNNKIQDVEVTPMITKTTILTDRVVFDGEVGLNFLYEENSGRSMEAKYITVPFNYNMDCPGVNQNTKINTDISISMQDFTVMSDQNVEIKVDLEISVNMFNTKSINVIEEININETRSTDKHSLIIYFVKSGDTLWNIAKKFHSTMQSIAAINKIEDENKLNVGDQLFIPISL